MRSRPSASYLPKPKPMSWNVVDSESATSFAKDKDYVGESDAPTHNLKSLKFIHFGSQGIIILLSALKRRVVHLFSIYTRYFLSIMTELIRYC
jgi:hypothetical protein